MKQIRGHKKSRGNRLILRTVFFALLVVCLCLLNYNAMTIHSSKSSEVAVIDTSIKDLILFGRMKLQNKAAQQSLTLGGTRILTSSKREKGSLAFNFVLRKSNYYYPKSSCIKYEALNA